MNEFDAVVLTKNLEDGVIEDLRGEGLHAGDFGYIVDIHPGREKWTVEFFDEDGQSIALANVAPDDLRPAAERDFAGRKMSAYRSPSRLHRSPNPLVRE